MKTKTTTLAPGYSSPDIEILGADLGGLLCASTVGGSTADFEGDNQFVIFEGQGI